MIEEKEDFFEKSPEEIVPEVKPPKKPKYNRDDPRFYDEDEGPWDHLMPSPYRRGPLLWIVGLVVVAMCLLVGMYIYFFTPRVQEAVQYGYVDNVQKEGTLFHTFEGVILPYKSLMDTVRPYEGDMVFSAKNMEVATDLLRQQKSGNPVRVEYKVYRFAFPWRGKSKTIVTRVDSVDPRTILPPDRQPEVMKQQ